MVAPDRHFRVNSDDIVSEAIEGEVIAIDLARGSYYSLRGSAVIAWSRLQSGCSAGDLATSFTGADPELVEREMLELLDRLAAERLVVSVDASGPAAAAAGDPAPYETPQLEKYDDMQDYFLLDPIHEVGATGWPPPAP
jgi:hypothetical protein